MAYDPTPEYKSQRNFPQIRSRTQSCMFIVASVRWWELVIIWV